MPTTIRTRDPISLILSLSKMYPLRTRSKMLRQKGNTSKTSNQFWKNKIQIRTRKKKKRRNMKVRLTHCKNRTRRHQIIINARHLLENYNSVSKMRKETKRNRKQSAMATKMKMKNQIAVTFQTSKLMKKHTVLGLICSMGGMDLKSTFKRQRRKNNQRRRNKQIIFKMDYLHSLSQTQKSQL